MTKTNDRFLFGFGAGAIAYGLLGFWGVLIAVAACVAWDLMKKDVT